MLLKMVLQRLEVRKLNSFLGSVSAFTFTLSTQILQPLAMWYSVHLLMEFRLDFEISNFTATAAGFSPTIGIPG